MKADDINKELNKLSVAMRTRKCMDHIEMGVCRGSNLTHVELDEWIEQAEAMEDTIDNLQRLLSLEQANVRLAIRGDRQ